MATSWPSTMSPRREAPTNTRLGAASVHDEPAHREPDRGGPVEADGERVVRRVERDPLDPSARDVALDGGEHEAGGLDEGGERVERLARSEDDLAAAREERPAGDGER